MAGLVAIELMGLVPQRPVLCLDLVPESRNQGQRLGLDLGVHRVTRPRAGPGRLSFPFLVRPRQEHVLDTTRFDPTGTNARLVEISGIPCSHLRKLFDARFRNLPTSFSYYY